MLKSIKYITFISILSLFSRSVIAANSSTNERWFEVEVILFNQLDDKSTLKEQFPDTTQSASTQRKKRVIELLLPFLKPNIHVLKSHLPVCGESLSTLPFVEKTAFPEDIYHSKTLLEIKNFSFIKDNINITDVEPKNSKQQPIDANKFTQQKSSDKQLTSIESFNNNSVITLPTRNNKEQATGNPLAPLSFVPLSKEDKRLVVEAEQAFSPYQFNLSKDYLPKTQPSKHNKSKQDKNKQLCRLPAKVLASLSAQDSSFNPDDYTLDKIPSVINGNENIYDTKPYLLSKSSLKLNGIVKQLRWSKYFRPLLHLGWRLAPKDKNFAIPMHIIAGNNLQADYQKRLAQYNNTLEQAKALQAQSLAKTVMPTTGKLSDNTRLENTTLDNSTNLYQRAVNIRLTRIIEQLQHFDKKTNNIISELNNDDSILKRVFSNPALAYFPTPLNKPQPPLQKWFLDGFITIHLHHYLFINANFTLLNKTLAEQAKDSVKIDKRDIKPLKLIQFKQNRRVISKEIHYFDNPYIGMIVQIRRFKRPEPPKDNDAMIEPSALTGE